MTCAAVITGFGVFSAFGLGPDGLRRGVFSGRPAFAPVARFDTAPFRGTHAAEYQGTDPELPARPRQWDALVACIRAALNMAGVTTPFPAPVLVGTQGDFTVLNRFWKATVAGAAASADAAMVPDPEDLAQSVPGELAHRLGDEFGLGSPRIAFVNACVASSNAVIHASQLIDAGRADVVVVAGSYLVDEEFFAKFDSGRAFASDGVVRPFAEGRTGLLLGDGAAALIVESAEHASTRDATVLGRISGWGFSNDAYHLCRPHPEGAGMATAITQALGRAQVCADQLGYVNAHGTGTAANDVAETRALHKALGAAAMTTPISSTKSMTGHMLEASGVVEAVICLLVLSDGVLPPTANYVKPDPACDLDYVPNQPRPARVRHVLSLNSAFGGLNTALLLERP